MEWMATITSDHVGYPGFRDILGSKNSHIFRRRIFVVESNVYVYINESIDVNTALKNSFWYMSCLGRIHQFPRNFPRWQAPGCISYILSNLWQQHWVYLPWLPWVTRGWALSLYPLIKSPLCLPWLLIFWVSDEKLVMSQLYKNWYYIL
jgi:hypothetical protein